LFPAFLHGKIHRMSICQLETYNHLALAHAASYERFVGNELVFLRSVIYFLHK
jgi:hypothetical protein